MERRSRQQGVKLSAFRPRRETDRARGNAGAACRAPFDQRPRAAHAEAEGDAEPGAPGALSLGAGGVGAGDQGCAAMMRPKLAFAGVVLAAVLGVGASDAAAQNAQFKGWAAISRELS